LFICATYEAYDGPGNVLAIAGPDYVRTSNNLPTSGNMVFDLDDLANMKNNGGSVFFSTILHEMGHVLGT
jgi:hypothetical protein